MTKSIIFILILTMSYSSCASQKNISDKNKVKMENETSKRLPPPPPPPPPPPSPGPGRILKVVEEMPRFPGCEDKGSKEERKACATEALLKFIYDNLEYPALAKEHKIEGICIVSFVIEKNGRVSTVKIVRGIGYGCNEEAVRVVNLMNIRGIRWTPARSRGPTPRVQYNLPVKF